MNIIDKIYKLVNKIGYAKAVDAMQFMIDIQNVKTIEEFEEAIEEELILLEVE